MGISLILVGEDDRRGCRSPEKMTGGEGVSLEVGFWVEVGSTNNNNNNNNNIYLS